MKRYFSSVPKLGQSTNENPQTKESPQPEETPQVEEAIETEPTSQSGPSSSISSEASDNLAFCVANANTRLGLGMDVIVSDPGLRTPIEDLDLNIKNVARREYINLGPCQPIGHTYKRTPFGKAGRLRSFHDNWYKNHGDWLEYSIAKDAAFCFFCFLFKQPKAHNYGIESFTKVGFKNWKDGPSVLDEHVGKTGSAHNKARLCYEAFKNQRQSVANVMEQSSIKDQQVYKARMIIMLGVIRFLMLQALAFRGHDESESSKNKGNFLEMMDWYKKKDPNARTLLESSQNHLMTCHEIQKDLCRACAEETTKSIISDIGDRKFSLLVDESRDGSIKEQMAMVLRLVYCLLFCNLHVINCFLLMIIFLIYVGMLTSRGM
jgi:hypothetical protein